MKKHYKYDECVMLILGMVSSAIEMHKRGFTNTSNGPNILRDVKRKVYGFLNQDFNKFFEKYGINIDLNSRIQSEMKNKKHSKRKS